MSLLNASDMAYMIATENQAMSSTALILRPSQGTSALGFQDEYWSVVGTVNCDCWPIPRFDREKSSGNQELSKGEFYISVPYNTDVSVIDVLSVNDINYKVTFVPKYQSWLTNQRVEAYNYNSQITVITVGAGTPIAMSPGTSIVYVNIVNQGTVALPDGIATEETLDNIYQFIDNPFSVATVNKSSVNASTVQVTLLNQNTDRNGVLFFNNSTADFYFNYGTVVTTNAYTLKMTSQSYWEMPTPTYKGQIVGLWSSVNGELQITETESN
jgi:hypothetical protein